MNTDVLTFGRLRGFGEADKAFLLLSILCGVVYLATQTIQPFPGSIAVKALSIAPLAVLAFKLLRGARPQGIEWLRDRDNLILGTALSFSCLGDIFLDLPGNFFVQGLVSFLVAHFIYILLFVRNWSRPLRPNGWQLVLMAGVLITSLLLSNWLSPNLGAMAKPVMVYICAITVMVISSILAGFSKPYVWVGAVLFLISDSMIAAGRFKTPVPFAEYLIWATYYLGQYGIAIGFLREKLGER
ncbi:MAG: lysoplasmalogenase [Acidobacteria bacterium]|nr:lysoplasmalogenase [Acidobacteriota bacterium]